MTITYFVESLDPNDHIFNIKMIICQPDPEGQIVSMPNWIPGSYLFRDYAKHIITLEAFANSTKINIKKLDSNTWLCDKTTETITIEYTVYAWDLTVEGTYLDQKKGFINGCALFLMAHHKENEGCKVKISPPHCPKATTWQVATSLLRENETPQWGFGWYYAQSYEDLIDHPIAMGTFKIVEFCASNIPHYIVIWGNQDGDLHRLGKDVTKICEQTIQLFEEPPPFDRFLFLVAVIRNDEGGGLEHAYSCALMVDRDCFPIVGDTSANVDYIYLLSLFSHEYFHTWNVKRIKPLAFIPYDLNTRNYSNQLWAFEGVTSYFGDLALIRSKVITTSEYFNLLSQDITKLLRTPGREVQTVTESSFDVWIKYNEPDENSLNAVVNYYVKGKLIGLIFDIALRLESNNAYSMDAVMRMLWSQYGKLKKGVPEQGIDDIVIQLGGTSMAKLVYDALYTTQELPLDSLFTQFGLNLTLQSILTSKDKELKDQKLGVQAHQKSSFKQGVLGCTTYYRMGRVYVYTVIHSSAASKAGISAKDEIVAINNIRVDSYSFEKITKRLKVGQVISVHVFRHEELLKLKLVLTEPPHDLAEITIRPDISPVQKQYIESWLKI